VGGGVGRMVWGVDGELGEATVMAEIIGAFPRVISDWIGFC